ncbi:molybdopterin-dependent oxidoreductase [Chloroflexota bacterium]
MEKKTTLNICPGSGCWTGCIHRTRVKDGKIVKVETVIFPHGEEGAICVKGVAGARLPYNPDRLKYPLKRAGKRGEGKWERITWEQALDEIADKLKRIREEYMPESVVVVPSGSSTNFNYGTQSILGSRLQNLLQATDIKGTAMDSNTVFSNYFTLGSGGGTLADPRTLLEGNTKYMIVWGNNPVETAIRFWKYISEAQKKGAKLVDIGLAFDSTAQKADWWIPVNAGSDTALALAMISVIINEKLYDEEYVIKYTNGPFLVRADNGKLLRESDISSGGDPKKYVIWDTVSGQPRAIAPNTSEVSDLKPALLGTYEAEGIECRPAFQMLVDLANLHPPKKVEEITGVSSENIGKLAREYAAVNPAAILISFGLRYKNSGNTYRAIATLAAITGNVGIMGGGAILGQNSQGGLNAPKLAFNDVLSMHPNEASAKTISMTQAFKQIANGEPYPIKAAVIYGVNWVHTYPNPRRWLEEVFPNLDLIVVNDIFMTATAEYADYVLPDCTVFEREDIAVSYGGYIVYLEKAIEPMYECKPPIYFWSELAKRLGLGQYFDKTIDEWIELRLDSQDPSIAGIEPPLTLERLKKEKMIRANVTREPHYPFPDKKFPTPSGRIEFYNEELIPTGDALPVFREGPESPRSDMAKKYPLLFNTSNNKFFMHSMFANEPSILKAYKMEPYLNINPKDAKERGIKEDDIVEVYNDRGSFKAKATINEIYPPGVINIPHGWWPKQFIEGHLANLPLPIAGLETRDEAREIYWSIAAKHGGGFQLTFAYSPDMLSECLCEVKKGEEGV